MLHIEPRHAGPADDRLPHVRSDGCEGPGPYSGRLTVYISLICSGNYAMALGTELAVDSLFTASLDVMVAVRTLILFFCSMLRGLISLR